MPRAFAPPVLPAEFSDLSAWTFSHRFCVINAMTCDSHHSLKVEVTAIRSERNNQESVLGHRTECSASLVSILLKNGRNRCAQFRFLLNCGATTEILGDERQDKKVLFSSPGAEYLAHNLWVCFYIEILQMFLVRCLQILQLHFLSI